HVVAHEVIQKAQGSTFELWRHFLELREGLGKPMGHAHILSLELFHQLDVVVSRNAQGTSSLNHVHDELKDTGNIGPEVDKVPQEDRFSPGRRTDAVARAAQTICPALDLVPELREEGQKLVQAPVDIANDVEGPMLFLQIVPELRPSYGGFLDLCLRGQD